MNNENGLLLLEMLSAGHLGEEELGISDVEIDVLFTYDPKVWVLMIGAVDVLYQQSGQVIAFTGIVVLFTRSVLF